MVWVGKGRTEGGNGGNRQKGHGRRGEGGEGKGRTGHGVSRSRITFYSNTHTFGYDHNYVVPPYQKCVPRVMTQQKSHIYFMRNIVQWHRCLPIHASLVIATSLCSRVYTKRVHKAP